MDSKDIALWPSIIALILLAILAGVMVYNNVFNLDQVTGQKIGKITTRDCGDYEFKFVTTQNDTLECNYPAPVGTPVAAKAAMEINLLNMEKTKQATLYGKTKRGKFIIRRISN